MIKSSIQLQNNIGYAGLTRFTATSNSFSDTSIQKYAWTTGDGYEYLDVNSINHSYKYAGTYTITLTVWDQDNNKDTSTIIVNVLPILNEGIYFSNIPRRLPGPGLKTETPFTVSFITTLTGTIPVINLFADASTSIPDSSIDKGTWKEIAPTWYFTDTNGNKTTELTATDITKLYRENTFVGLSGSVNFYFYEKHGILDPFIQTPTTLIATLKTSNAIPDLLATQNNFQKSTLWYTDKPIPENLAITENYIRNINPLKWSGVDIPYLITANYGNKFNVTKSQEISSSIAFNFPDTSISENVTKIVTGDTDYNFKNKNAHFIKNTNNLTTGGFIQDSVNIKTDTTTTAQISANVVVDMLDIKSSVFTNTFLPIFNSDNAIITEVHVLPHPPTDARVAKLKLDQILETEYKENFNLESFFIDISARPTGIYSVATDPTDATYWVTDSDRVHLYKFDKNNNLLKNINLNQFFNTQFVTNEKKEKYLRAVPLQIVMDGDKNLYVSFVNDFNILKLDKNGNLIKIIDYGINVLDPCYPTPYYPDDIRKTNPSVFSLIEVDKENNLWVTHTNIIKNELRKYTTTGKLLTALSLKPLYTPTSIHCDNNNNIWISSQIAPFLVKPSQDIYQQYWNWHDLNPAYGNNPLRWVDTRNIGISSIILGVEYYPPGKYTKRWERENSTYETLNTLVLDTVTIDSIITSDGNNLVSENIVGDPCIFESKINVSPWLVATCETIRGRLLVAV
jgi:sugar lactone lactonase YvrE